jgi:hypothetical protein
LLLEIHANYLFAETYIEFGIDLTEPYQKIINLTESSSTPIPADMKENAAVQRNLRKFLPALI